jgi:hypothetical protein
MMPPTATLTLREVKIVSIIISLIFSVLFQTNRVNASHSYISVGHTTINLFLSFNYVSSFGFFAKLPADIQLAIISYLDPPDVCRISSCSKLMNQMCQNQPLWESFVQKYFSQLYSFIIESESQLQRHKALKNSSLVFSSNWKNTFRLCLTHFLAGKAYENPRACSPNYLQYKVMRPELFPKVHMNKIIAIDFKHLNKILGNPLFKTRPQTLAQKFPLIFQSQISEYKPPTIDISTRTDSTFSISLLVPCSQFSYFGFSNGKTSCVLWSSSKLGL